MTFVGVGPGDPGLVATRGREALAEAEVVVADRDVPISIVEQAPGGVERILVPDGPGGAPEAVAALLGAHAARGRRVVRLALGDGSSFQPEVGALAESRVAVTVVPGLAAGLVAACLAGIPWAAGATTWLLPPTPAGAGLGPSPAAGLLLAAGDAARLAEAVGALRDGRWPPGVPAAVIADPGTPQQRVCVGALEHVMAEARGAGLGFPAVLAVGAPVARRVPWLERRPLHGRRILITRPRAQAGRLAGLLEGYGAEVLTVPTIRLEPPEDWGPLDDAIQALGRFRWIVFTSVNGVAAFRDRLYRAGRDARSVAGARVAAIGPETAEALRRTGIVPDLVPAEYRAEGLVAALGTRAARGDTLLLVRAAEARDVLPRELEARGVSVAVAPAYRTALAKEGGDQVVAALEAGRLDAVTFTSSSTVRGFMSLVSPHDAGRLLARVAVAAIGPVTAATVAEHGLRSHIVPQEYTIPALVEAIVAHFEGARPVTGPG